MTDKLSFEEYRSLSERDLLVGYPCACMGPRESDPYCPCMMNFLDMVKEEDQPKLQEWWRSKGIMTREERIAKETEPKMSEFRKRRLELMEKKRGE